MSPLATSSDLPRIGAFAPDRAALRAAGLLTLLLISP